MNKDLFADVVFAHGKVDWTHKKGDRILWIGRLVNGKKFRKEFKNTVMALSLNAWNARMWLVRGGKRKLLKTVVN